MINWLRLVELVESVPEDFDKMKTKVPYSYLRRKEILKIRGLKCEICDRDKTKGITLHHILPNGDDSLENTAVLHKQCHKLVHLLLWIDGKWRFINFR